MKTIAVTEFKAHCLQLLDELSKTGETLLITKRGRPLAEINPVDKECRENRFGLFADQAVIVGDLDQPLNIEWEAQSDSSGYEHLGLDQPRPRKAA